MAEQVAAGVRQGDGATYGIADDPASPGPTGGTPDKPVGTVWMAVSGPDETYSIRMVFGSLRSQNIERASSNAINLLAAPVRRSGKRTVDDPVLKPPVTACVFGLFHCCCSTHALKDVVILFRPENRELSKERGDRHGLTPGVCRM